MTAIAIVPEPVSSTETKYRAISGACQSLGRSPGEALDMLSSQLGARDSGTLIVVQGMKLDEFFSEAQRQQLTDLMRRWRLARDEGSTFSTKEQTELEVLVAAELKGSAKRPNAANGANSQN